MTENAELETERLLLRRWRSEDFPSYAQAYADEQTARFIGGVCDAPRAWRQMAAEVGHWALRGYGFWALEEKATGRVAGSCGLWFPEGWPEPELGYWLLPHAQGRGYATEAALRAREYAYGPVGLTTLVSFIAPANEASRRVAERVGARLEETIELLQFGPHGVYRHPGPA